MKIEIIYSDENIIVVTKPTGVSVTKDRSGDIDLKAALEKQNPELAEGIRLVHRLDKLTSGVMVLARNKDTQSKLSSQFAKRMVKKTYLALATGFTVQDDGVIDSPITRNNRDQTRMMLHKRGKPAITKWRLLGDFGSYLLLKVNPVTGRTHQIRTHLKSVGMPLAIDPLYGGSKGVMLSDVKLNYRQKPDREERPLIDRLTLHAYQLELDGYNEPFIGKLDKNFAAVVKMLSKHCTKSRVKDEENIAKIIENCPI